MGRRATTTPAERVESNARYIAAYRQRRAERDQAASENHSHKLKCTARTRNARSDLTLISSLLLAVNDQLRLVGDVVVSLDDVCKDAFDTYKGNMDDDDAALKEAVLGNSASKTQCEIFLVKFLFPTLKRGLIIYEGGIQLANGEYELAAGTAARSAMPCDGEDTVSESSALFVHIDKTGFYSSIYLSVQAFQANSAILHRGGDIDGEGDDAMESVFDAVNRQLRLAELTHEVRDTHAWREAVVNRMHQTPKDVLRARAPIGFDVIAANPHLRDDNGVGLGVFLLNTIADEIGMRIIVYKGAVRHESKPIRQLTPSTVKYSGALLVSVEPSSTPVLRVFRSVTPRVALSARLTEGDTIGIRQRNARDAERRNPGSRAQREQTWATGRHRRAPVAADTIRNVSRKMRNALRDDNMDVCDVCDEEDFTSDSNIKVVHLSNALKTRWVEQAPTLTAHGHGTRSNTPESVRACKACAAELSKHKLPWNWKLWAPKRSIPTEVAGLNDLEFSLIAPVQSTATVYVANPNGVGYVPENATNGTSQKISKHNSMLFRRDVDATIERVLPRQPDESGMIFVARRDSARRDIVFPIRIDRTLAALEVLRKDNPGAYEGVRIDQARINEYRSAAQNARDHGQDPDHAFDDKLIVLHSDDVVNSTFRRTDASQASGSRSEQSSASYMHELENEDDLRAALAELLPQPRVPSVQHVNAAAARGAPRIGEETERVVSEYGDNAECVLAQAFLRLFYGGGASPHVVRSRLIAAGQEKDAKFTSEKYIKHLMRVYDNGDRRFQRDHQFLFYTFNAGNRREISQVSARLAGHETIDTAVVREVAEACNRDAQRGQAGGGAARPAPNVASAAHKLIKRLGVHMSAKRGSPTSTERARRDVLTMINSPVCGR